MAYTTGPMDIYERLAEATGFDWDSGNAEKNRAKHGVTQAECEQVFFNAPLVAAADAAHSGQEARFFVLGQTDAGRLLFEAFTLRGTRIRVISARDMSRKERSIYVSA